MTTDEIERTLARAIAAGILPPSANLPRREAHPWPVTLLNGFGA